MIHEAYMPVYMGSRFLARDGRDGTDRGSTRGPRGPKNTIEAVGSTAICKMWTGLEWSGYPLYCYDY